MRTDPSEDFKDRILETPRNNEPVNALTGVLAGSEDDTARVLPVDSERAVVSGNREHCCRDCRLSVANHGGILAESTSRANVAVRLSTISGPCWISKTFVGLLLTSNDITLQ